MAGEKIEAEFTVPTGMDMTVRIGAGPSATVTATPGATFMTSLLADIQTGFNNNSQGYPTTAQAMQSAVGYGTWSAGWLFNITSGNDTGAFGGVTMTAVSTPTYNNPGPRGGIDKAVGFDSASDAFSAGNNFDANGTSDVALAGVVKFSSVTGSEDVVGKGFTGASFYQVYRATTNLTFRVGDGVDDLNVTVPVAADIWYAFMAVLERASNTFRLAVCPMGGAPTVSANTSAAVIGSMTNASNFVVGDAGVNHGACQISALYVATGTGAATGLTTNLSQATQNFASAVNSSFAVSQSQSTGLVTISNSFWPNALFFPTALREVLGFPYDFNDPQTAAALLAAIGYGVWTGGAAYGCNETATPLLAAFGLPASLAEVSTPTYSSLGVRGGADRAVGFNSADDAFSGGDVFDVGASDDLLVAWVGYVSSAGNADFLGKWDGSTGWVLVNETNRIRLFMDDGPNTAFADTSELLTNEWYVGIAYIDRTAGKVGVATKGLRSGTTSTASGNVGSLGSISNAGNFRLGDQDGYGAGANSPLLSFVAVATGSAIASGMFVGASTAISNFATSMKSVTGTSQCKGTWFPGCNFVADSNPKQAPTGDDGAWSISPTGRGYKLMSSEYRRQRNCRFPYVSVNRAWANDATTVGADWETFFLETQNGHHSWFAVGSRVKVYWDNAGTVTALGNSGSRTWTMPECVRLDDLVHPIPTWTGLVEIKLGDLYADG